MLKIAVDARSLLRREPRGEGKTLLRLYEELLRLEPRLQVCFFGDSSAAHYSGPLPDGVTMDTSPTWGHRVNAWENFSLPWRAWRSGCQLLHCASSGAPAWSPLPIVMTVHDLIPALQLDGQDTVARDHFLRRLRHGVRQARQIITVSEHTRQDLLQLMPGLKTPITVVHWGCDPAPQAAPAQAAAAPYVMTFGGSAPRKNTIYTLERFAAVARSVPNVRLVVAGIGHPNKQQALMAHAATLGIADRVDIPGYVTEAELDNLLRGARALAYLSTYEGFGLPVLEAVVRGVPVVSSDASSMPELLAPAPGCFDLAGPELIEAALVDLMTDDVMHQHWHAQQHRRVSSFTWQATANKTLALLVGR